LIINSVQWRGTIMAKAVVVIILGITVIPALSGCGTVVGNGGLWSAPHYMEIYGGVKTDIDAEACCLKTLIKPTKDDSRAASLLGGTCALIDLPLSAVADTLILPWTVKATLNGDAIPWPLLRLREQLQEQPKNDELSSNPPRQ
jgi:uncharacterized protein YceK